jgi:aconitate hydratase
VKLPFSIKVLLESCLRNMDNFEVTEDDVKGLAAWNAPKPARRSSCRSSRRG